MIIIDYLQLIKSHPSKVESRTQELSQITRELKLLAKNFQVPLIVLSQLNRNIEHRINKRPLLSDLRESGCISFTCICKTISNSNINKYKKKQPFKLIFFLDFDQRIVIINKGYSNNIQQKNDQYLYTNNYSNQSNIISTHNHVLLTEKSWEKNDQIKNRSLSFTSTNLFNNRNIICSLEMVLLKSIKSLWKAHVYDLSLHQYKNFIVNNIIIHNSIEQDADLVLMLHKEKNLKKTDTRQQVIDIIVAKNRNGPIGSFQLIFHNNTCKFKDLGSKYIEI